MKWIKVTVQTTNQAIDAVSNILMDFGAKGVELIHPDHNKSGDLPDSRVSVNGYLNSDDNEVSRVRKVLKGEMEYISNFLNTGSAEIGFSVINDEDWANNWKKYYKPIHVTDRIVIKPTWEYYNKKQNETIIEIDPGMAFGTGLHETTRMCIILMEKYINAGDSVLDLGCGTGILSIISSKIGASAVTATDIDEMAVKAAANNCLINNIDNVKVFKGGVESVKERRYQKIVVNIVADVILEVAEYITDLLTGDGIIIASGIIRDRLSEIKMKYYELGYEIIDIRYEGEWVAIVLKCRGSL